MSSAKKTIEVAAYIFTSAPVSKALLAAHKRGVRVRVVADKKGNNNKLSRSALNALVLGGIEVRLNSAYAIHHDKFMIIDSKTVQTGSLNYTSSAMSRNSENVLVIRNQPKLAQQYYQHWLSRFKEAEPYSVNFSQAE
ncbi:phospholipase D family protein [Microvirga sp. W0021]|uniref:Phospholipase D n=1 Tax=Hohaiivirga grylli TaxID=3133970 RepID=A0ABV0BKZ4_9HYPH